MANRVSDAEWRGDLKTGQGNIKLGSGAFEGQYSYNSRFAEGVGTNPEELIAAAHAGCFSMALAAALSEAGHAPDQYTYRQPRCNSDPARAGLQSPGSISSRMLPCRGWTPPLSRKSPLRQSRTTPYRKPSERRIASRRAPAATERAYNEVARGMHIQDQSAR